MLKVEPAEVLNGLHGGCERKRSLGNLVVLGTEHLE